MGSGPRLKAQQAVMPKDQDLEARDARNREGETSPSASWLVSLGMNVGVSQVTSHLSHHRCASLPGKPRRGPAAGLRWFPSLHQQGRIWLMC